MQKITCMATLFLMRWKKRSAVAQMVELLFVTVVSMTGRLVCSCIACRLFLGGNNLALMTKPFDRLYAMAKLSTADNACDCGTLMSLFLDFHQDGQEGFETRGCPIHNCRS